MRIKKHPEFEEITCTRCGTVFVPDHYDDIVCTGIDESGVNILEIECPTCGTFYRCKTVGYDK